MVSQQGFEVFFYVEARGFEDYSRRFFILKKSYQLHGLLDTAESKYLCSGIESIDTPDSKIRSFDTNISAKSKLHSKMPYIVNQEFRWGSLAKIGLKISTDFVPTYLIEWLECRAFKGRQLLLLAFQSIS